jgi:WD40 repeat protein
MRNTGKTNQTNFSKGLASGRSTRHTGKGGRGGVGGGEDGSGPRSRKKKKDDQARVIVDGRDVTPQPLAYYGGSTAMHASIATQLAGTAGNAASSSTLDSANAGGMSDSELAHGSVSGTESDTGGSSSYMQYGGGNILDSDRDWAGGLAARLGMNFEYATDGTNIGNTAGGAARTQREWSDKELREKHTIKIEETSTITLLHIPSLRIWGEDEPESLEKSLKANKHYLNVLEKHKEKDKYTARLVQTLNNSTREKEIQVAPPSTRSVGGDATTWDLFDVAQRLELQIEHANAQSNQHAQQNGGIIPSISSINSQAVPKIQHETDLIARTANLARTNAAAAATAGGATRQNAAGGAGGASGANGTTSENGQGGEEDEEYAASMRASGGGVTGRGTGSSNTPSQHSAAQSYARGASGANSSFRGGASKSNMSWHQGLSSGGSQRGGGAAHASQASSVLQSGGAANSSVATGLGTGGHQSTAGGPGSSTAGNTAVGPVRNAALDRLFSKPSFTRALRALEQGVLQSSLHEAQLLYRNHPEADLDAHAAQQSGPQSAEEAAALAEAAAREAEEAEQGSSLLPKLSSLGSAVAAAATGFGSITEKSHTNVNETNNPSNGTSLDLHGSGSLGSAALVHLWSFRCPLTQGMNVSCLSWNKQNVDLLAAGYGSSDFGHTSRDPKTGLLINGIRVPELPTHGNRSDGISSPAASTSGGMILFWSLKNPAYPQKIFYTSHAVSSLDFSDEHPHLLAAGLYDGSVAIYDIRDTSSKPALESAHQTGKHSEAVWGVKWVCKELHKRSQQLTSISTDGSVKQWNMKKGLVPHELMQLKRTPNRAALQSNNGSGGSQGAVLGGNTMEGISRDASGLCFDFPITDGTQYFAGTEEGLIHRCSVSYNEQTLDNFYGHTGPVYRVRCSPFLPDAFLSCSADWSAMLWSSHISGSNAAGKAILKFSGGHDAVQDIIWSPNKSTIFALATREGRVEVWDLEVSPLDPIVKIFIPQIDPNLLKEKEKLKNDTAAATAGANSIPTHHDGSYSLDSPSKLNAANAPSTSTTTTNTTGSEPITKRFLSCVSFNATAPVLLVGTSDGSIELYRLEGTALTSTYPTAEEINEMNAIEFNQLHLQSFGQELNAERVMQVPRDRERMDGIPPLPLSGISSTSSNNNVEVEKSQLQVQQENLLKFRQQAKILELIMEQHVDSKNKLALAQNQTQSSNVNANNNGNTTTDKKAE